MNIPDINTILSRNDVYNQICKFLTDFEKNKHDLTKKRGIYLYGSPGCGKTTFVRKLLKDMNYDSLVYDAGDIRNKSVIEKITKDNMTDINVMSSFYAKKQNIAIVMDEIDGMNNGDKGGLNTLIKLIRPKKTRKQQTEDIAKSPIICISNYHSDKKIKELRKVCEVFELPTLTPRHILQVTNIVLPDIPASYKEHISNRLQGDLRKLSQIFTICSHHIKNDTPLPGIETLNIILHPKTFNEDTKQTVNNLFNTPYIIDDHLTIMNETDRTIVGLLWHENIIDILSENKCDETFSIYIKFLENICFSDYIDRITFQKQIWQFNEMSSLIKTFYTNKMYHDYLPENKNQYNPEEVRFTKVLTKYSTEYNNILFIYSLSQELDLDKSDLISLFQEIRLYYDKENINSVEILNHLETFFQDYDISKLDIKRLYRYLDKNSKKDLEIDE